MNKSTEEEQLELIKEHKNQLSKLIGTVPNESAGVKRIRSHQGWWRAVVMGLPEGQYFDKINKVWKRVCNRTDEQVAIKGFNFLTPEARSAAEITVAERTES